MLLLNATRFCSNVDDIGNDLALTFAGNGGLSLKARLDIAKGADEVQGHLQNLEKSSGVAFELEVDYIGLLAQMGPDNQKSYSDCIGEMVKRYLQVLDYCFERQCKIPLNQEAVQEFCTTKKIAYRIFKTEKEYLAAAPKSWKRTYQYGRIRIIEGTLTVELNNDRLYSNVDDLGGNFDDCFAGTPGGLTLKARRSIVSNAKELEEHLDKIAEASKVKFDLEVDYLGLLGQMEESRKNEYMDSIGEMVQRYVGVMAYTISNKCKDALNQEAVQELCSAKKITFKIYKNDKDYLAAAPKTWKRSYSYGRCRVVDGVLVAELSNDRLYSNIDDLLNNFDDCFSGL